MQMTLAYISQAICSAGPEGCYHEGQENVFTSGPNKNGSNCCTCRRMFHDVCLHVFEGNFYCTNCYKNDVVSMCATETLFDDVFKVEFLSTQSPEKGLSARKNRTDLLKFVDNFLLSNKLLTFSQYEVWEKKTKEEMQKEPATQKNLELDEKIRRRRVEANYYITVCQYRRAFEMAKKEWKLSTDGVVRALRYDMKEKGFAAKIEYQKKKSTHIGL
ncbi:MAG: hypothetical protein MZW92_72380 [Comamonadaceae bacterium]|nr:hypothetical protein [Comamonadaceae bacterium]